MMEGQRNLLPLQSIFLTLKYASLFNPSLSVLCINIFKPANHSFLTHAIASLEKKLTRPLNAIAEIPKLALLLSGKASIRYSHQLKLKSSVAIYLQQLLALLIF